MRYIKFWILLQLIDTSVQPCSPCHCTSYNSKTLALCHRWSLLRVYTDGAWADLEFLKNPLASLLYRNSQIYQASLDQLARWKSKLVNCASELKVNECLPFPNDGKFIGLHLDLEYINLRFQISKKNILQVLDESQQNFKILLH